VNFLIENWMLVAVAAASALALFMPTVLQGAAGGVAPNEAVLLINREKAVLIDVCEPHEFAQGHVVGSKNIPLAQLEAELPSVVKNKSVPVILVCQAGSRASRAAVQAKKLGYERAQALAGGLKAWREASLPTEKA
jgi:rhodanese-related sulfurtransferase